ncbi:MAG: HAD-IB family hydrolase [Anaerolineae bacterium]|nr:HAD-IB family hydrolase [Anaerolineae bacterium]
MTAVAFFDLDYTLLNASSGLLYIREALRQRRVPWWVVSHTFLNYQLKRLDFGQAHGRLITHIGRHGPSETAQFFSEWIPRRLLPRLTAAGQAKINWHRSQGHRVVILSASIEEIVKPVAEYLGLGQDYLCTRLAVENDRYTGALAGPLCYGPGKVYWAEQWALKNNLTFPPPVSYFYTDSSSDLPLLEMVAHPVPVNPSRKLAKIAAARGWTVERFY